MCCIEFFKRDVKAKKRGVSTRYKSAATLSEMMEFADRECRARGDSGYRLHDLHTDTVNEVWD